MYWKPGFLLREKQGTNMYWGKVMGMGKGGHTRTDGRTDGQTDGHTHTPHPLNGTKCSNISGEISTPKAQIMVSMPFITKRNLGSLEKQCISGLRHRNY